MAALQVYWRKKLKIQSSSPSHQTSLITMNTCSIKMQQFLPTMGHAPISWYTCPLCPYIIPRNTQTIWKYNALYHLISEHSNNDIIPEIPGELLVKIFFHKAEEIDLGIDQNANKRYITKSLIMMGLQWLFIIMPRNKKGRSETMSTNLSDKHNTNRHKYAGVPEAILD